MFSGAAGSGKTHLLLSLGSLAGQRGLDVVYLPLAQLGVHAEALLGAQPAAAAILIDDLQEAESRPGLQLALFALHNRQRDSGGALLYAGRGDPHDWDRALPDLVSRLGQCTRFNLPLLNEVQRRQWFADRAEALGFALEAAALDYLFRRVGRDMHSLSQLLQRLDHASLAQQRRVTVPFLRQVLSHGDEAHEPILRES